jgi:hypothetical protein
MFDAQGTTTPGRPWHLWLIGVLGALEFDRCAVLAYYARAMSKKGVLS